jgi:oligopeptide/dipeptide ABC transporter ATP-binding protein
VVRLMAQRIAVMYLGKVVELGIAEQIFTAPRHPYTQTLLASVPVAGGRRVSTDFALLGEPPNPANKPTGCAFRTRCNRAEARCSEEEPPLRTLLGGLQVACHFAR